MKIEVRLFATLRKGRDKKVFIEQEEGLTPLKILEKLNIDIEDVAILLINGHDGDLHQVIKDEDYLSIFPPVGGG